MYQLGLVILFWLIDAPLKLPDYYPKQGEGDKGGKVDNL